MLSSTTCVGLRYGRRVPDARGLFLEVGRARYPLSPKESRYYPALARGSTPNSVSARRLPAFVPPFAARAGAGMLTRLPSASPLGLSLGPGSP